MLFILFILSQGYLLYTIVKPAKAQEGEKRITSDSFIYVQSLSSVKKEVEPRV